MRRNARWLWLLVAICGAFPAQAQFANRSLGLSLGYAQLQTDQPFEWAIPLSLEGSLYVESGWDVTIRMPVSLITERVLRQQVIAAGTNLGIRYLFSEEAVRPYIGVELATLFIFASDFKWFVGPGAQAGIDFFVSDSVSIGARAFFNLFVKLNEPPMSSMGGQGVVATYF
jgi:outer membrane protein